MKRVAIVQSDYLPWKGYFDIINSVDEFIVYDNVQYTRRDWRNRNLIKTAHGVKWLSVPVKVKERFVQTVKDTEVVNKWWADKHLRTIRYNYLRSPYYKENIDWLSEVYAKCKKITFLSDINLTFILEITKLLKIKTKISFSEDYHAEGTRSEKLLSICKQAGASEYVSGPSASGYLDTRSFINEGISVKWMAYNGYIEYPQLYPPFVHQVSILDLILNTGNDSAKYMKSF